MLEALLQRLATISFDDALLKLAIVLVAGIVGGELVARLHLPKVTGWIGTGILLRGLQIPGLDPDSIDDFAPYMNFVLGYIAFTVGAALYFASLRNAGKRLGFLLLGEAHHYAGLGANGLSRAGARVESGSNWHPRGARFGRGGHCRRAGNNGPCGRRIAGEGHPDAYLAGRRGADRHGGRGCVCLRIFLSPRRLRRT